MRLINKIMIKINLYNFEGKKKEELNLPKELDVTPNVKLLSQAIHVYEDRAHFGLNRAKTRGEVAISTRKIYRQKGTGGARHGARSAPIFVGGGAAHGPKGIKRILHLSASQRKRALVYALNYKASDSMVVMVDGVDKIKKTKEAAKLIKAIVTDCKWLGKNMLFVLSEKNSGLYKSFRNIKGLKVEVVKNLNAYRVFLANGVVMDREILEQKSLATGKTEKNDVVRKSAVTKEVNAKNTKSESKKTVKKDSGSKATGKRKPIRAKVTAKKSSKPKK